MRQSWTPQMDDVIWAGIRANLRAGQIARKLRVTRNAVIGRAYRLRGYRKSYPYKGRAR